MAGVNASASWMDEIHSRDPYAGFPIDQFAPDLQGWNESSPIFEEVVKVVKPRRVIEVGTWKGASAIRMAQLLKQYGVAGAQIVCVDTWLGSAEHWLERDKPTYDMRPEWGRPTLYQQFIANVIHAGQVDTIIPFPIDSLSAAQFFAVKRMLADAIYIDASHDYDHVLADVRAYWNVLRPGGVMFGDDYHLHWIGVVRAVHDFADASKVRVNGNFPAKWLIQKPA